MGTYPQWPYEFTFKLLNTQKKIFIGFVDDLHNLDILLNYNNHMSKISRTP